MRISLSWLKELVDITVSPKELAQRLVETGTEVEAILQTGAALDHVVVGEVLTCVPHPNSDHMHICEVAVGAGTGTGASDTPLQIVCGAPNVAAGQKVAVACIGAVLPGDFKIKKSKLRGVESCGMICSAKELGLSGDHKGIMVLDASAPVGMPIAEYLGASDIVFQCEITPNRPDCLSMRGLAREVGAILDEEPHVSFATPQKTAGNAQVNVQVAAPELCPRYTATVIRDVKIGPSPAWLVERLEAAGIRSINNAVDITNYVMLLCGQPLHAFDADTFSRDANGEINIGVRQARVSEKITTLDGQERTLTPDMLVITDAGEKPVALAGVMGGEATEISDATTNILLESAVFDAGTISRTSRDLQLVSEASLRYERGVDRTFCKTAALVACALLEELAGGTVAQDISDMYLEPYEPVNITLRFARIRDIIGAEQEISAEFMTSALTRLGCEVRDVTQETAQVTPPPTRPDLARECDLCEEILRLWGMDNVEAHIPGAQEVAGKHTHTQKLERLIHNQLVASGANEAQTFCFATADDDELLGIAPNAPEKTTRVELLNPLTQELPYLRQRLLPGLLRAVAYNTARDVDDVRLFEQGRTFEKDPASPELQPQETSHVAYVAAGARYPRSWNEAPAELDFFDAKAVLERVCEALHVPKVRFSALEADALPSWLQPGKAASVKSGKTELGWIGSIHPTVLSKLGISQEVVAFELNQDALLEASTPAKAPHMPSEFPAIKVDLALVVDEDVSYETVAQRITSAGGKYLQDAQLFDVYRDNERVGEGKKSLAFSLTFRAEDRSLTSEEVATSVEKLTQKLERGLGATVRT